MRHRKLTWIATWIALSACAKGGSTPGGEGAGAADGGDDDPPLELCESGLPRCGDDCVDLDTSELHCGTCDTSCAATQACVAGNCVDGVGALVLSEISPASPAFVELYNGTASAISLDGFQLQWDGDGTISGAITLPDEEIQPGQFLTVGEVAQDQGEVADIEVEDPLSWQQRVAVRLLSAEGLGVDFVRTADSGVKPPTGTAWQGPGALNPERIARQVLVRNVYAPDTDSSADWSLTGEASPGSYCAQPGRCGDRCLLLQSDSQNCGSCGLGCKGTQFCSDSACVAAFPGPWISEVKMSYPGGVEVHNPTGSAIDLKDYGLTIAGPEVLEFTFPFYNLASGGYVFVYASDGEDTDSTLFAGKSEALFADDLAVTLYDPSQTAVDYVIFGDYAVPPPQGAQWFGESLESLYDSLGFDTSARDNTSARRDTEVLDSDSAADWHASSPATPGFACWGGLSSCDGVCVDLSQDRENCGSCGESCEATESCSSGICASVDAVVISEITIRDDDYLVEIYNGGKASIDIEGWVLVSTTTAQTSLDFHGELAPGGFRLVTADLTPADRFAVALKEASGDGVDFVRLGAAATPAPAGTAWQGANIPMQAGMMSVVRDVFAPDSDGNSEWTWNVDYSPGQLCVGTAVYCTDACELLHNSAEHCGVCGNTCGPGGICQDRVCRQL